MDTNDLNRRIRYAFSLDDADVLKLFGLAAYSTESADIEGWRTKPGETGYRECPAQAITALLDGLIIDKRGAQDASKDNGSVKPTINDSAPLDNNRVLKQLRIALSLRAEDVGAIVAEGGGKLGKSEVSALFRKQGTRNYRQCGDQVLRWFLSGLAARRV